MKNSLKNRSRGLFLFAGKRKISYNEPMKKELKKLKKNVEKVSKSSFVTEFKEFINRGSVLDLAVGVIIGGAFQKIISSLVSDIIMPLVGLIAGGVDFRNLEITIPNLFGQDSAAHIRYGNFLQNMVDFLIIAFCVFLIIKIMNKFIGKFKKEQEEKAEPTTDEQILEVLKDIRKHQK